MNAAEKVISITLTAEQRRLLRMLRSSPAMGANATLEQVIEYAVASICDGVRREGSWEAGCVASLFGEWSYEPPPCCPVCEFDLLDEDDPFEMETKHCEACLIRLIDEWEQSFMGEEEDRPAAADPRFELCDRAFNGDPSALRECWQRIQAEGFKRETPTDPATPTNSESLEA
jgi:hypothetical protein